MKALAKGPKWLQLDGRKYEGPPAPDALKPPARGIFLGRDGSASITVKEAPGGYLEFSSRTKLPQLFAELIKSAPPELLRVFQRRPGTYSASDVERILSGRK